MMGGGMSSVLGVIVVLLMLTIALLYILNRKAVAARDEFQQDKATFFDPAFATAQGEAASFWSMDPGPTPSLDLLVGSAAPAAAAQPDGPEAADDDVPPAPHWDPLPVGTATLTTVAPVVALSDPVAAVVEGLLEGAGDLTPEELRRLELYRPQRVIEYATEAQAALTGRGREAKRARLERIKRYAESLQPEDPATEVGVEPVLLLESEAAATPAPTSERIVEPAADDLPWTEPPQSPLDPDLSLVPDEEPEAVTIAPEEQAEASTEAETDPALSDDPPSEAEIVNFPMRFEPVEPAPEADTESMDPFQMIESGPPVVDIAWPDEPQIAPDFEAPLPVEEAADAAPVAETWEAWPQTTEVVDDDAAVALATELGWDEPRMDEDVTEPAEEPATPPAAEEATVPVLDLAAPSAIEVFEEEEPPADPLAAYQAADGDPELKRQLIDRLVEEDTAEALSALQQCLDDEDPEIQLYALEAAERVLSHC